MDTAGTPDPLAGFAPATRAWFTTAFAAPTPAQVGTWQAVRDGAHALVVAPTGSGKTLAAFLWALDGLLHPGRADDDHAIGDVSPDDASPGDTSPARPGCRVLYVSPLKALAADVEHNLRSPLVGIRRAAQRLGGDVADVRVGVRTGDTPPSERRAFATDPPDILVTTPESLFLVLTSAARAGLADVRTVVVDEIHALAGTKRGAHLALSLERLDALLDREGGPGPAQRIGLSATVRPVDAVAGFLTGSRPPGEGGRPVHVVTPPSAKRIEVDIQVPVPDLTELGGALVPGTTPGATTGTVSGTGAQPGTTRDLSGPADAVRRPSVWPHVEERVVDLVAAHRSTLVFTNSRRGAERLTSRINEVWATRQGVDVPDPGAAQPAAAPSASGTSAGVDTRDATTIVARAHHGSMSRAERTRTESELKAGRLPAVVATSSLELGIDMGAVDLVVQVGAPPSVASGLQRVGRAGHQVGAVSRGVVLPTHRGELIPAAVIAERMRAGAIEALHVPSTPLDVLAQQVVAMVATDDWTVEDLARVVRRAAPFARLGDATLHAVLDMLAGRYPSEDFGELRPRLVWDRTTGTLSGRPGALRLAVTSGGTIPDRGAYPVFLVGDAVPEGVLADPERSAGRLRGGKRVGELDEEMVYESRAGDTFTLGSSTWRIEQITPDRVLVSPAPGVPGRLPFWKGDAPGRPAELGAAVGAWLREVAALDDAAARERLAASGLDEWARDNLLDYLREQRAATGVLPDDRTVVVERFRDELGDWRVVLHSPYGARVHAGWALVVAARLRERFGVDAAAMHADDGIVLRLPDLDTPDGAGPGLTAADLLVDPEEVAEAVRAELSSSAMLAARFREAAARALLLPRRRPDRRSPLWQQRLRATQLLQVASAYPDFPVLLEAVREVLSDDLDLPALTALMADVAAHRVRVVEVTTPTPSPFARSLLFGYTAQFLYEGDAPLAERRAAALTLDPALLAELLGDGATPVADLLDPAAVVAVEAELAGTDPERQVRDAEGVADVLRRQGPLPAAEVAERVVPEARDRVEGWLAGLAAARRAVEITLPGLPADRATQWAVVEDAGRLRDGLGVALPLGLPDALLTPVADPLGDLVRRHARWHGPFAAADVAARFGLGTAVVAEVARRLVADGVLTVGRLRPEALGGTGEELCDPDVLRRLRRRSLAALRAEVEPVPQRALGVFLPRWQQVTTPAGRTRHTVRGVDGLVRVVEQLAGVPLALSVLEQQVLPARVADFSPALLDELVGAGHVVWAGHAPLPGGEALVSLHPAATADLTLPEATGLDDLAGEHAGLARHVADALAGGGAFFLDRLTARVAELSGQPAGEPEVLAALWELVWARRVTNDSLAAARALATGAPATRAGRVGQPPGVRPVARSPRLGLGAAPFTAGLGRRPGPRAGLVGTGGRWSLLPERTEDPTLRAHALAGVLLDRHGVLTRAAAPSEELGGLLAPVYRVLAAAETAGQVRRGYFVEHLGGSQFALPGAVDQLRADARGLDPLDDREATRAERTPHAVLLAATDPANPYGAALAWPAATAPGTPPAAAAPATAASPAPASPTTAPPGTPPAGDADPPGHRPGRKAGAAVVLVDGALAVYVERGGRSALTFTEDAATLTRAADLLVEGVRAGWTRLALTRVDGAAVLGPGGRSPLVTALVAAGGSVTPRGLRLRERPG